MKDNYSQSLKLDDLSVKAFLSCKYFCKIFKDHTGMTVFEYVHKIRIEEACRLLKSTSKKVADISCEVDYSDLKFFN
jgi:AraC family L-rhamnose operon transcriptional activator RhaR